MDSNDLGPGCSPENLPTHVVGIGASAGGLEAIEAFFAHMPSSTGLAFIVVQHLSPDYKSLMVELLSKRTPMPVHRAEEGMLVEADSVYLIPPKKNLTIFHGRLLLSEQDHTRGINLPIDVFLRSLADDQSEKAIGIILSGTGSDGMRGIRGIKESGGMVMVQDPESAKFDGMPRSAISTGLADFILAPDEMPHQLLAFAKHPYVAKMERSRTLLTDEDGFTRIFAILREKTKVDFTYYKPSTVIRRIERRMTVNQIHDLPDYVKFLESYPGETASLYRELLIGVTNFFRDREAFELLGDEFLPELLRKGPDREIRFWVAGCSTGEEAYSLAILCREAMESLDRSYDIKIFATDVDRDAIVRAGNGVYPESSAADLSPLLLTKYFYRRNEHFQVARHIREMVVFAQHNLVKDPPFTNIDLITCRNLLIYLQPVLQKKAFELFNFSLAPQGLLFLGSSETTGEMADYFEPLNHKWKIYRSKGKRKPAQLGQDLIGPYDARNRFGYARYHAGQQTLRAQEEERVLDRFLHVVAGNYIPLALIVNENMEPIHVLGDTEGYFKLPPGKTQHDVSKMAGRELAIPLATGIQKAFKSREEVRYTNIRMKHLGVAKSIQMRIMPLPDRKGQEPLVAVFVEEAASNRNGVVIPESYAYDIGQDAQQRIMDLEQELQFTKENLQATIEELETSNEELQATNEELLSSNEELQSTNEELQSVNEELHTVNAEYQSKILQLTELNNDVDNLLASTRIGILFLDENLEIRKFTPQVSRLFKVMEKDLGRPINHLTHRLVQGDPLQAIEQVHKTSQPPGEEVQSEDGQCFLMRVMPYNIGPQSYSGVVIAFIDISQLKEAQKAFLRIQGMLNETGRMAKIGGWELDIERQELLWTQEVYHIHEVEPAYNPTLEKALNFYAPDSRELLRDAIRQATDAGRPFDMELEFITAAGNPLWVKCRGKATRSDGRTVKVSGTFQDITTRKQAEQSLLATKELLSGVLDTTLHCVMAFRSIRDDMGRIVDFEFLLANPAAARSIGHSSADLVGRRLLEVLPRDMEDGLFDKYVSVVEEGIPWKAERYHERDGAKIWFYMAAVRLADGFAVSYEDITERKKAEQEW